MTTNTDIDWRHPEAVYPYTDDVGTILWEMRKYHPADGPKLVVPFRWEGGRWQPGAPDERVLYRLPAVLRQARACGTVIVVEGEKDAESVAALGMCATTAPFGAWRQTYCKAITGATAVILVDRDQAGYAKGYERQRCLRACGVLVDAVLRTPLTHKGADVSDHLVAGLSWADLEPVPDAVLWGLPVDGHERWTGEQAWRLPADPRDGSLESLPPVLTDDPILDRVVAELRLHPRAAVRDHYAERYAPLLGWTAPALVALVEGLVPSVVA